MTPYSLLVVDNNRGNLIALERLVCLHVPDCVVVTAESSGDGLQFVESRSFDGALIEAQMPDMDGIEMTRQIKAKVATSRMSVLLIADGSLTPRMRAGGLDAGADDFISRPIDDIELAARIRAMLRRQHACEAAEDQTRQHQIQLAHLSRLSTMGELSRAISHELTQPLCAIVASSQACRRMLTAAGTENTAIIGAIDQISAQAKRAGQIIHNLQEFSHRRQTHRSAINLSNVVRDAVNLIASETRYHHVNVSLSLPSVVPPVIGDAMQIEQVLVNLIRNAIEAMQQTDKSDRKLDISLQLPQTDTIEVSLRDTGCGLPEGKVERLFVAFFSTKPHGMGTGLTVSRSIIEAHGGQLWARPAPDMGAVFYFTLPVAKCETP